MEVRYPPEVEAQLQKCRDMLHDFEQSETERLLKPYEGSCIAPRPEVMRGIVEQVLEHPFRRLLLDLITRIMATSPKTMFVYPGDLPRSA